MDLVLLTSCGSNIEASSVRAVLEAHELFCYVQGEQHRSMLGVLGAYVELRVMVHAEDLEEARAVLAEARALAAAEAADVDAADAADDDADGAGEPDDVRRRRGATGFAKAWVFGTLGFVLAFGFMASTGNLGTARQIVREFFQAPWQQLFDQAAEATAASAP